MANSLIDIDSDAQPTLNNTSAGYALRLIQGGGNATVAPLLLTASATASAPAIHVETGGFASITSILVASAAHFDYAIRVKVGGQPRWIPCIADGGLVGTAAVA